jgi:hypothetical protein
MSTRALVRLLLLAFSTTSALGHTFDRKSLEIYFVGSSGTFTVADAGTCSAVITAAIANPAIASVDPGSVTAVRQTFTVTAKLAGMTTIAVSWRGVGEGCTDVGSDQVTVTVISGPDLTLSKTAFPQRIRVGDKTLFNFVIRNIGDASTSGPINIVDTLARGFRLATRDDCVVSETTFNCSVQSDWLPFEPGAIYAQGRTIEAVEPGIWSNVARVEGGSDIRLTNNSSEIVIVDVVAAREAERAAPAPPAPIHGRR